MSSDLFPQFHNGTGRVVRAIDSATAASVVVESHYLHRSPPISWAFGLFDGGNLHGVVTFGVPASRELMKSACPKNPNAALELNRLWVSDDMPRNTETWFLSRALMLMPSAVIVSYADMGQGHAGYVYRAANFHYAGWTDMDRMTPRFDYASGDKHSRDATRQGKLDASVRVPRSTKVKYWTVTGPDRRARRSMEVLCAWPSLSWKDEPPPASHTQRQAA